MRKYHLLSHCFTGTSLGCERLLCTEVQIIPPKQTHTFPVLIFIPMDNQSVIQSSLFLTCHPAISCHLYIERVDFRGIRVEILQFLRGYLDFTQGSEVKQSPLIQYVVFSNRHPKYLTFSIFSTVDIKRGVLPFPPLP